MNRWPRCTIPRLDSRSTRRQWLAAHLSGWAAVWAGRVLAADSPVSVRLRPGHPRIWLTTERLQELRTCAERDAVLRRWIELILADAERRLRQSPPAYKLIGPRLLYVSREYLSALKALGFAWQWTRDPRFAKSARTFLQQCCGFADWHPSHFLDTAEMACAVGVGYDWVYDALSDADRTMVENALVRLGLEPGVQAYQGRASWKWWVSVTHNWNQVCNGGMLVGALALADVRPELADFIVRSAVSSLPRALASYEPDGAWGEGPGYWGYATMYTAYGLEALRTALGDDEGLSRRQGLARASIVPRMLVGPTGLFFNYADCGERHSRGPMPWMFWLARTFGDDAAAADEHRVLRAMPRPSALHAVWYVPAPDASRVPSSPLDVLIRGDVPVMVSRSRWDDPEALWVAIKAGHNTVNHSHLDLGTFVLEALGQRWVVDLGSDDYNLPGYFGRQRWTYYRLMSESHAVPLIAGRGQDPQGRAEVLAFHTGSDGAQVRLDLTRAYADRARRVWRGLATIRGRSAVVVQDEFELVSPAEIVWGLTTPAEIELVEPRRARLSLGSRSMTIYLIEPAQAAFEVHSAERPPPEKTNRGMRRLEVRRTPVNRERIVVLFVPGDRDTAPVEYQPIPLERWR